jgi:carbonic anhydrase/acetyltransferase-like protein (isoleucine patch superfamily)
LVTTTVVVAELLISAWRTQDLQFPQRNGALRGAGEKSRHFTRLNKRQDRMPIHRLGAHMSEIAGIAFVATEAVMVGQISLGERSSVWFGAAIRDDNEPIVIGAVSNVQEGTVLHADPGFPLTLGERVTVGHQAMLHAAPLGEGSLIGIQAVVLNGAVIGRHCLVGAGAIVTERKVFPDRCPILNAPVKVVRELSNADVVNVERSATDYAQRAAAYLEALERVA